LRSLTQLNPSVPLYIPEKGAGGEAIAVIDYSKEDDLLWVIIMDDTGEIWTVPNAKVRGFKNYSIGRMLDRAKPSEPLAASPSV
jgi:hypothetical protein